MTEKQEKTQNLEKAVYVYSLANNGCPEYQGRYDFRSFVMRNSNVIAIPYSPIDHPFPFLDTITPKFNSFLLLKEDIKNKSLSKEIHHIVWKQADLFNFKPYLFSFPLNSKKERLMQFMSISPDNFANCYELWRIKDHRLDEKVESINTTLEIESGIYQQITKDTFDSLVMMKIIPLKTIQMIKYHLRISFLYIGKENRFIGSPVIIGLENPEEDLPAIFNLSAEPFKAPKWVNNCRISFVMKKNSCTKGASKWYDNYVYVDNTSVPYFQVICKLVDVDAIL